MADQHFGHFQMKGKLGQGILSTVYEATNLKNAGTVALKIIRPEFATKKDISDRYNSSSQIFSTFDHQGLVRVRSTGVVGNYVYMEQDFIEGKTLHSTLKENGPLPAKRAMELALQVATALEYLHAEPGGRAHGAVVPRKIMLVRRMGQQPKVILLDGCSFSAIPIEETIVEAAASVDTVLIYSAPERIAGAPASQASDIFQFGAMLYEMVAGEPAFDPAGFQETAHAVLKESPKPLREINPDIPAGLDQFVARCMEKDPDKRIKNATVAATFLRSTIANMNRKPAKKKSAPPPKPKTPQVPPPQPQAQNPNVAATTDAVAEQQQAARSQPEPRQTAPQFAEQQASSTMPTVSDTRKQSAPPEEKDRPQKSFLKASMHRIEFSGFKPSLILVQNFGSDDLKCEVLTDARWVRADPVEFTIPADSHQELVLQAGGYPSPNKNTATLEIKSDGGNDSVVLVADWKQIFNRIAQLKSFAVSFAVLLVAVMVSWALYSGRQAIADNGYAPYSEWTPLIILALGIIFFAGAVATRDSGVSLTGAVLVIFCLWHIFFTAGFDLLLISILVVIPLLAPFAAYLISGVIFSRKPSLWYMAVIVPIVLCAIFGFIAMFVDTSLGASGEALIWHLYPFTS